MMQKRVVLNPGDWVMIEGVPASKNTILQVLTLYVPLKDETSEQAFDRIRKEDKELHPCI